MARQKTRKAEHRMIGSGDARIGGGKYTDDRTVDAKPWRQKECPTCRRVFKGDEERAVHLATGRRTCLKCAEKHAEMGGASLYERATNGTESEDFQDIR
tara:strand:- start:131 stop:427 length:297 start_codon:yes stop_codon:yes gene_type:complete